MLIAHTTGFGRSPHGERELKFVRGERHRQLNLSLPTRGAWVEIVGEASVDTAGKVAPHTGSVS